MNGRRYRVALAGYYGFGNLGDELLAEAALDLLERNGVEREAVVVLSNAPDDTAARLGADSVNRWRFGEVRGVLRRSDTLLLGGGGLFQDRTSLRSCLYYWGLVRLACLQGAVPWALSQSVGPLSTFWGRRLTRNALSRCRILQVRDTPSQRLCDDLKLPCRSGHDLLLARDFEHADDGEQGKKILVNLRPEPSGLGRRFAASLSPSLPAGCRVLGTAMSPEDEQYMLGIQKEGLLAFSSIERMKTFDDVFRHWRGASAALGMRLHFAEISALHGTPTLLAAYDPKVRAFAETWEIPMLRDDVLPHPAVPTPPHGFSPAALREENDALCRAALDL